MKRQDGMAVVMALLIVALAASASALVLWQQGLWLRQVEQDRSRAGVRLAADGGLAWAMDLLRFDGISSSTDHLGELWAQPLPKLDAQGFSVAGQISDAQGRFNLNNLVDGATGKINRPQLQLYRQLLMALDQPPTLAEPLLAWMGARGDDDKSTEGSAPRRMARASQLAWVPGYRPEVLARLLPQVVALPENGATAINVNTATPEVMAALVPALDSGRRLALLNQRRALPFKDQQDFLTKLVLPDNLKPDRALFDVKSSYFLLDSEVSRAPVRLKQRALLSRSGEVSLVWREEGGLPPSTTDNHDDTATPTGAGLAR
ncbi:type II secretion system minor pseudopilin GspK [Neisseriaceae bacterium JH1-16]|nr:type II secretion system minor pseudopilin GspK [Neisseriaceae bacterium JH1-16]